jgi:hypothetical protein
MKDTKDMTNEEFMANLMTPDSYYGELVQVVILGCLQRGLDEFLNNKDEIIWDYKANLVLGRASVNMMKWIECCEEVKQRIEEKYS